jgi:signal transduction histidine kinase
MNTQSRLKPNCILLSDMKRTGRKVVWPASSSFCGKVLRSHNWADHPLGPPAHWPASLKVAVGAILDCTSPLIVLWGRDLFQIYNDAYAEIMGSRHPSGMGQKTCECWPEVWEFNERIYEQVFAGKTIDYKAQLLSIFRGEQLQDCYFDLCYSPLRDESNTIQGVLVTVFDVTARMRVEDALRLSNRRLNALVAATSYSTYSMSADWREMRRLEGSGFLADTHEANPRWLEDYIHPDDQESVLRTIRAAIIAEENFELEHRVRLADGSLGWTMSRAVPLRDEQGKIVEWFGAASDVTAKKLAELALLENEKLAVVGRLASSIAHEINNPLESVTNLVFLAKSSCEDGQTREYLATADAELQRVSHIVAATLSFHRQSANPTSLEITDLLDSVLTLHQGRIVANAVKLATYCSPDLRMTCWPNEVRQVLANLVSNAVDAMKTAPKRSLVIRAKATKRGISILVSDTGAGISVAFRRRIFDAFFTTKDTTGTGLGLWVSKNIMVRHGGAIRVRSAQSGSFVGTTFALFFPADIHDYRGPIRMK